MWTTLHPTMYCILTVRQCNEVHPVCGNCQRHQVPCIYDHRDSDGIVPELHKHSDLSDDGQNMRDTVSLDLPESRDRRLLELKLLHHYNTKTSETLLGAPNSDVWTVTLPKMAFQANNDALLHAMYAISALHLTLTDPSDRQAVTAHHTYRKCISE